MSEQKSNVVQLSFARARFSIDKFRHNSVIVDEELAMVECGDCGAQLNPIWILARYAREESRLLQLQDSTRIQSEKLAQKQRCKCQHCGRMTPVRV